jgi:histidine triad (HIT) family protein
MDCVFCKIATKKMPSTVVNETERTIVVKDINPQAPTHLLVIPRTHYSTLMDCDDSRLLSEMIEAAKDTAKKLGIDKNGFRIVINTNEGGGQTVFHLHMHLLGGRALAGRMG